jgi:hypothetical protein
LVLPLGGCAGVVLVGIPVNFLTTEVAPRAVNGKGLVEDGVDWVTGKDCRLIDGVVRDDRQICEPKGSPATKKDFKGLSGLVEKDEPAKSPAPHTEKAE